MMNLTIAVLLSSASSRDSLHRCPVVTRFERASGVPRGAGLSRRVPAAKPRRVARADSMEGNFYSVRLARSGLLLEPAGPRDLDVEPRQDGLEEGVLDQTNDD